MNEINWDVILVASAPLFFLSSCMVFAVMAVGLIVFFLKQRGSGAASRR